MRLRPFHLAFILFQSLWLNVVLPGHTRGIVTLAGCNACASAANADAPIAPPGNRLCCSTDDAERPSHHQPTPKERANCAICAFAARVAVPPPVDFAPVRLRLLAMRPLPPPLVAVSLELIPTYHANAPPRSQPVL